MKLKILNLNYNIKEIPSLLDDDGKGLYGKVSHTAETITIDSSLSQRAKDLTLIHEAMHSYNFQLGFWNHEEEESNCDRFATVFYDLLIHNKDLIRRMIK